MHLQEGFHTYFIYILTNKAKSVFYVGVTNNFYSISLLLVCQFRPKGEITLGTPQSISTIFGD
ncbi:hypothetical protein SAMN05216297_103395 [Flavobacterium phragmitis]|uniref:Uncharacterized protein n=1 Tax=Flavobacterium phragmitis TaxID=739143 RepID=A0A1I1NPZ4_9FLAO|nr:hypothetical protein SAMN05216297_103395 [Flavobacterium phragmitis]